MNLLDAIRSHVLMLATSILGPVLTERFAPRMLEGAVRDTRQASA